MALNALPAMQVQAPQINTVGAFQQSQNNALDQKTVALQHVQQRMRQMGEIALGTMGGDINGQANPDQWKQAMDYAASNGIDVSALKDHPELAPIIARGSLEVLKAGTDFDLAKTQLAKMNQEMQLQLAQAPVDLDLKKAQVDALRAKPAVTPTDDQRELQQINAERKAAGKPEVTMEEYQASKKNGTGLNVTLPDGTVISQGNMPKLTEGQSKDVVFVTRASGALPTLDSLDEKLTSFGENLAGKMPYGEFLQSEDYQKADTAGKEFLAAILRKDTGAAVTPSELVTYGQVYLPQPGNPPAVLEQKKAARARAVKAIAMGLPPQVILSMEQQGIDIPELPDGSKPAAGPTKPPPDDGVKDWTEYDWGAQ